VRWTFCALRAGRERIAKSHEIAKESKLEFKHSAVSKQPGKKAEKPARNAVSQGHVRFCRKKFLLALARFGLS
jgi:hypothetical protein